MADASVRLGHAFGRPELLAQALTHRSHGARHNERLEFVGDAVLNCVVALALYERFPGTDEGDLSRARASLVNGETLARIARRLELGDDVRLGEGELKSGGAKRGSILADALEAVFGAVFVDAGFEAARRVIIAAYGEELANANPTTLHKDPKTRLQEWLQARRLPVPAYRIAATRGQAHAQTFEVECEVTTLGLAERGEGRSRRAAEQQAARRMLEVLLASDRPDGPLRR